VSATPSQGRCELVTCRLGRLRHGGAAQVVLVARSSPALAGTTVVDRAAALAAEPERHYANNLARAAVTFTAEPPQEADIVVTKTADRQEVTVGDELTYRVTVENRGPGDAPAVRVTDTPSAAAELIRSSRARASASRATRSRATSGRSRPASAPRSSRA
jgi:uncharacterized repeat protein (TIGR01451 family)